MMLNSLAFLSAAIKDPNVGALCPTSSRCVESICRSIPTDRPLVVAEYGAGEGAFTRHLAKRLHPKSVIIAFERNRELADRLSQATRSGSRQARVKVMHGDAENALKHLGIERADYVLSGIPFSFLCEDQKRRIIDGAWLALRDGGIFMVYQATWGVRPYLEERFGPVSQRRALLNLPPLCVMEATKRRVASHVTTDKFVDKEPASARGATMRPWNRSQRSRSSLFCLLSLSPERD
jgi:phosphatidylethanolamine/phosphatidyl-N-methylethanolamine N-methyltransferase